MTLKFYECKDCQTQWDTTKSFKEHYKTHMEAIKGKLNIDVKQKAFIRRKCIQCDIFVSNVDSHRQQHTCVEKVCDTCGKVFTRSRAWRRHLTGLWL